MVNWKRAISVTLILLGLLLLNAIFLVSPEIKAAKEIVSNMIVSSALSLSGIYIGIISILTALYWSNFLGGQVKVAIRRFLFALTGLTIMEAVSCLVAFFYFLFGYDFLFLPMIILFTSAIYFVVISAIILIWLSIM